jgi:hypothetical protein
MKRRSFLGVAALAPVGAVLDRSAIAASIEKVAGTEATSGITNPYGLPGTVSQVTFKDAVSAPEVKRLADMSGSKDVDLARMAGHAMNYLINNPRRELNYEPVFQIWPFSVPPAPIGHDPIVPGDTDCRMDWEFIYMREMSGSTEGLDVERGLRKRVLGYVREDGLAWVPPGHYMEGEVYKGAVPKDFVASTWATAKIIRSLSETYERTHDRTALPLARKMFLALKKLAVWKNGVAYYEGGSGGWKDGKWIKKQQPTAAVEQLVRYWEVSGDQEALDFAIALTEGLIASPELLADQRGAVIHPNGEFAGHMHSTLHGVWGVAHLGAVLKEARYTEWAKRVYDFANVHSTGTGWVSAAMWDLPVRLLSETCATSDMVSLASWIARAGYPEYWDHVERYIRNYLVESQFFLTKEYTEMYREQNKHLSAAEVESGLRRMKDFEGGFIGNPSPNSWMNWLPSDESVKKGNGQRLNIFGCCVPEGMRALYTAWSTVTLAEKNLVLVNTNLNRNSKDARVVSFSDSGRMSVVTKRAAEYLLRPPSWTRRDAVQAYVNGKKIELSWSGPALAYVKFPKVPAGSELTITYPIAEMKQEMDLAYAGRPDLKFTLRWRGNRVTSITPEASQLPIPARDGNAAE